MVIELSGVQFGMKSYPWFQNQTSAQCEFDLKSQVWFHTKIAWHEVQLPLYYTHFEITQFFVNINIYLMFTSGKPALNFNGLKKECDLEHKIVQFGNKLHCWEPIRLQK